METSKIHWLVAIELLKQGQKILQTDVDFNNELIPVKNVGFFNRHQIKIPESLIFYDDENIDCSDIPEITDEDLNTGKIKWIKTTDQVYR